LEINRENVVHLEQKLRPIVQKDKESSTDDCFQRHFIRIMFQNNKDLQILKNINMIRMLVQLNNTELHNFMESCRLAICM